MHFLRFFKFSHSPLSGFFKELFFRASSAFHGKSSKTLLNSALKNLRWKFSSIPLKHINIFPNHLFLWCHNWAWVIIRIFKKGRKIVILTEKFYILDSLWNCNESAVCTQENRISRIYNNKSVRGKYLWEIYCENSLPIYWSRTLWEKFYRNIVMLVNFFKKFLQKNY